MNSGRVYSHAEPLVDCTIVNEQRVSKISVWCAFTFPRSNSPLNMTPVGLVHQLA